MRKFLILLTIIMTTSSYALTELDLEFGYDKQKFGSERQNKSVTRRYSGSIAFYFLSMTAIEFNYSESEAETITHNEISTTTDLTEYSRLQTQTYGAGIRQALASRKSFLVPTISLGWARQKFRDRSTATIKISGTSTVYDSGVSELSYDSVFGAFGLKLRLTKTISLKASVKTAFKAFEWDEARDQLSYTAGITWIF